MAFAGIANLHKELERHCSESTKLDLRQRKQNQQDLHVLDKTFFNTKQMRKARSFPEGINTIAGLATGCAQIENQMCPKSLESGLTRSLREFPVI